ncbi:hypothetical protein ONZ45_g18715 [Pleurotus djamor]|nr:hypothetical protein ONZ45_g18715 [Pleurotus djamor]
MSARCGECGANTIWDEDAASTICSECGTLTDPSQSVLTTHFDQQEYTKYHGSRTLKSFRRTAQNWDLAGQGKEARDNRNTYAMHDFVRSLSNALSVPGLSPRTITLFTQAMATGQFRWGRKARCLAGVCLAIALRESNRPDGLNDIAVILQEPPSALTRIFLSVLALLHLNLNPADPTIHIARLEAHLISIVKVSEASSNLPSTLVKKLSALHIQSVMRTVQSLSNMIYRLGESSDITTLPTGPTAAALVLLALEAESRASLPGVGELAQNLASLFSVQGPVVMARYKIIQDLIADCILQLPWVEKPVIIKGRAKVAKRTIVARSLHDAIQFHEDIWATRRDEIRNCHTEFSPNSDNESENHQVTASTPETEQVIDEIAESRRKKRKLNVNTSLDEAHRFILDPVSCHLPLSVSQKSVEHVPPETSSSPDVPLRPKTPERPSLLSYVLNASPSAPSNKAPSRLQLLATTRGGESNVLDDELLTDLEWSQIQRSDAEQQQLQAMWEDTWDSMEERTKNKDKETEKKALSVERKSGKRKRGLEGPSQGSRRINMEAYKKLMGGDPASPSRSSSAFRESDGEGEGEESDTAGYFKKTIDDGVMDAVMEGLRDEGEVIVGTWRTPSPSPALGLDLDLHNHYDYEDYD